MNEKKVIIILCLIFCAVLSVQAISAADVDSTIETTSDVQVVNNSDDLLSSSLLQTDEIVGGDGDSDSFSDLKNLIDTTTSDTLTIDKNYTYVDGDPTGGIQITKSITINAEGNVVIDAQNSARIFVVSSGTTVTLNGIKFINGFSAGPGGLYLQEAL